MSKVGVLGPLALSTDEIIEFQAQLLDAFDMRKKQTGKGFAIDDSDVTLTIMPEIATLLVRDDRRLIQAHEIIGLHSLGLLGMRERARHLGGFYDIHGEPEDATFMTVSIPARQIEA